MNRSITCLFLALLVTGAILTTTSLAAPIYHINSIAPPTLPRNVSSGTDISPSGIYISGWTNTTIGRTGFVQTEAAGTRELPALSGNSHPYVQPLAVNNHGVVVGVAAATGFGAGMLPLIWEDNHSIMQLPLPAGYGVGTARAVNDSGLAVGMVANSQQRAATFTTTAVTILSQTLPNGDFLSEALDINNSGQIVGTALSPDGDAGTRAFSLTPGTSYAMDLGALPGKDTAMALGVSENGYVVGGSSLLGEADLPFFWSVASGMTEIPTNGFPNGTARAVNSDGWVVGELSGLNSVPFLYDGKTTYLLNDLIPAGSGWNLLDGLGNSALGISEDGTITGAGYYQGELTSFVMTPVPEPSLTLLWMGGLLFTFWRRLR